MVCRMSMLKFIQFSYQYQFTRKLHCGSFLIHIPLLTIFNHSYIMGVVRADRLSSVVSLGVSLFNSVSNLI